MRRAASLVVAAAVALALATLTAGQAPAQEGPSQPPADPIGDLLAGVAGEQGMDDDTAETATPPAEEEPTATAPSSARPAAAPPATPVPTAPVPAAPAFSVPAPFVPPPPVSRLPQLDRPVMIDELERSPEAPPTASEQTYESRIRGGLQSAQGLQGPLDGGWVLRGPDGRTLYALQLVDRAAGGLEGGAFRSLRPEQAVGQVGLIDTVDRMADGSFQLRFTPRGAREPVVLTLRPGGGGWTGELWEAGTSRSVTMRRQ